ncbi:MAG: hypothetical protein JNL76_00210 [Alphaproteobacteria bacterium]|nr:hypothetical protein [Alphaproteobacteria bacterium]
MRKQNETRAGDPVNRCGKAAQIKEQIGIEFWIAPDLLQFLRIAFGAADFCGKVFGWTLSHLQKFNLSLIY